MSKVRVLVVDDSAVIRRLLTEILASEPDIEVVGTAQNGRIALERVKALKPDLVTLDIEMPEMDGITTVGELRKFEPRLPVIMFSTLSQRGAIATLDALSKGANDYLTKPSNTGDFATTRERIKTELARKIRALCGRDRTLSTNTLSATMPPMPRLVHRAAGNPQQIDVVAIGVSTGGPNALAVVIPALPADFPVPVVIVQHMPPTFTQYLAGHLGAKSKLLVSECTPDEPLERGHVYIAPGDHHMIVERVGKEVRLRTNQAPHENFCRPAVDVLFRSVASVFGSSALGVILTGMGRDGLLGCHALVERGGRCAAQDEATSVVWGMPGFLAKSGLADEVLPIEGIAPFLVQRACIGRQGSASRRSA